MRIRAKSLCVLLAAGSAASLFAFGCGDATFTEFTPRPTGPGTGNTFEAVMETIVTEDCAQGPCHDADQPASGLNLGGAGADACAVYDSIMLGGVQSQADAAANGGFAYNAGTVHPTNAIASFILVKPLDNNGVAHGGGKQFSVDSEAGYAAIYRWIAGDDEIYPGGGDDLLLPAGCGGGSGGCGCSLDASASSASVVSSLVLGGLAILLLRRRQ